MEILDKYGSKPGDADMLAKIVKRAGGVLPQQEPGVTQQGEEEKEEFPQEEGKRFKLKKGLRGL